MVRIGYTSDDTLDRSIIVPPWYVESPTATTSLPILFVFRPARIVEVRAWTDVGTVDFNIEIRSAPGTAGTDTMSSDLQATSSGATNTTFSSPSIPPLRWLTVAASAVATSPTKLWIAMAMVPAR